MAIDVIPDQFLRVVVPLGFVLFPVGVLGVGFQVQEVGADRAVPRSSHALTHCAGLIDVRGTAGAYDNGLGAEYVEIPSPNVEADSAATGLKNMCENLDHGIPATSTVVAKTYKPKNKSERMNRSARTTRN